MHILVSYSVFSITGHHYSHGSRVFLGAKIRVEGDYKYCSLCHRNLVSFDDSGNTLICPTCGRKQEIKPVTADDNSGGLKQKNPPISKRNYVAIMWDTNKTGIPNPEIRTSSDGGNTFANLVRLNSTSGGINK
jgi:hypothetical protein